MNAIQIPRAEMPRLINPLILRAESCVKYNVGVVLIMTEIVNNILTNGKEAERVVTLGNSVSG